MYVYPLWARQPDLVCSTVLQVYHVAREGASCGEAQLRWQMVMHALRHGYALTCVVDAGLLE